MTETRIADWLTLEEAAEWCGTSERTVRRWIREGRIEAYRVGPRTIRLRPGDLVKIARPINPNIDGDQDGAA